ncbi:Type IV leader peptidase family protein [Planctomycetes bacterium Pan216]|uniref:Type IV leader peptidase family protein n=1 Tax=Kolteria novifilia TaxID=2527975 RepID=A0A518AYJ9_9BACT|nr:Type IV leader peptidase family protein [Planctomycetes bacterium Pan216]
MLPEKLIEHWPVLIGCALLIVGAVIDGWKLKVPNWITATTVVTAWIYWGAQGWEAFGMSLLGTLIAGALLLGPWIIGAMGGGDVKLYAGFGAWAVPLPWFGIQHLLLAFAISVILGAAMSVVMIMWQKTLLVNLENVREILHDWTNSSSVEEVAAKAKERKPRLQLLPYGVPLTIGSLGYLAYTLPSMSMVTVALVGGITP